MLEYFSSLTASHFVRSVSTVVVAIAGGVLRDAGGDVAVGVVLGTRVAVRRLVLRLRTVEKVVAEIVEVNAVTAVALKLSFSAVAVCKARDVSLKTAGMGMIERSSLPSII